LSHQPRHTYTQNQRGKEKGRYFTEHTLRPLLLVVRMDLKFFIAAYDPALAVARGVAEAVFLTIGE
jgi:hypothetical protein